MELELKKERFACYRALPQLFDTHEETAETITQAMMTALPEGLKLRTLQWGKTGWDKTTGMFRLDASAKYAAYFVAEAAEDETVFTDFVLKGTVKERE